MKSYINRSCILGALAFAMLCCVYVIYEDSRAFHQGMEDKARAVCEEAGFEFIEIDKPFAKWQFTAICDKGAFRYAFAGQLDKFVKTKKGAA